MSYIDNSLAIVEFKLDELRSKRRYIDKRIEELIVVRDKIIREKMKDYEMEMPIND